MTKVKSGSILEDKEGYSRIVMLGDWIFVSLTAGRDHKIRAAMPLFRKRRRVHGSAKPRPDVGTNREDA